MATAAQALLERGRGKPRVEVATTRKSDSEGFIEALQEVAKKIDAKKNVLNSSVGKSDVMQSLWMLFCQACHSNKTDLSQRRTSVSGSLHLGH